MFNIEFLYQICNKEIANMKQKVHNECGIGQNIMDYLQ